MRCIFIVAVFDLSTRGVSGWCQILLAGPDVSAQPQSQGWVWVGESNAACDRFCLHTHTN